MLPEVELSSKILDFLKTKKWYNQKLSYFSVNSSDIRFILNDFIESIEIDHSQNLSLDVIFKNGFLVLETFKDFYKVGSTIDFIFKNNYITIEWLIIIGFDGKKKEHVFLNKKSNIIFNTLDHNSTNIKYSPYFYKPVITDNEDLEKPVNDIVKTKDPIDNYTCGDLEIDDYDIIYPGD